MCVGAPLFGCPDKVELKAGDNDLIVPCRIVSIHDPLMSIRVRVYDQTGMNFTIEPEMIESDVTTLERYIVRTAHSPLTVRMPAVYCVILAMLRDPPG